MSDPVDIIDVPVTLKAWPERRTCVICEVDQPDHYFRDREEPGICRSCLVQMRPPLWTTAGQPERDKVRLWRLNAVLSALEWETRNWPRTLRRSPTASAWTR